MATRDRPDAPETLAALLDAGGPKGDALAVARIAGIAAAKRTPDLIPLVPSAAARPRRVDLAPDRDGGA